MMNRFLWVWMNIGWDGHHSTTTSQAEKLNHRSHECVKVYYNRCDYEFYGD